MTPLPAGYIRLLELSEQMLMLAKSGQWEALTACEAERARQIAALPARAGSQLSPQQAAALRELLLRVQAVNTEVMEYVTPWREQVARWLPLETSPPA